MTGATLLALMLTAQSDTSLKLSAETTTGGGLLGTPGAGADAQTDRAGGQVRGRVRSALVGIQRRSSWGLGIDGNASTQFGDGIQSVDGQRSVLFFGGFGGDARGSFDLLPTLELSLDARGVFSRRDNIGFAQDVDSLEEQSQAIPEGTAFFQSTSVNGGFGLSGLAGRRFSWGAEARSGFTSNEAFDVNGNEVVGLPRVLSVLGSAFSDWAASRRTFLGAGLSSQYAGFSLSNPDGTDVLGQSSLILTGEGRFRRILSRKWEVIMRAGAFFNVPTEELTGQPASDRVSGFPAANLRLTYFEPPRERLSYRLASEVSLAPQLNVLLGRAVPNLRLTLFFFARFDQDWSLSAAASVFSLVDAPAFRAQAAPGSRPILQGGFQVSLSIVRRLSEEWSATLGVSGRALTRQFFPIRNQENTPENADLGFDLAFPQVLVQLGLRWNRAFPL